MTNSTVADSVLRRDRLILVTTIAGVVVISWIYLAVLAANMTGMTASEMMAMRRWTSIDFVLMFLMWSIMMVGMMLPSATPAVLDFAALSREHRKRGETYVPTTIFVLGYVAVWTAFSLGATLLQWALNSLALLSPMMVLTSPVLGGLVLIASGIYQWSPIHKAFLSKCRNPLAILNRRFGEGVAAFNMGLENGASCLGCCAVLMLLLFVGGVMNLLWVALITVFILVEKALPFGDVCARWSAIPLALAGMAVIVLHLV
jgi:predicted metal-binding membrane protein